LTRTMIAFEVSAIGPSLRFRLSVSFVGQEASSCPTNSGNIHPPRDSP